MLTEAHALREARSRWGNAAHVARILWPPAFSVGHLAFGIFFCCEGTGSSWEAALEDADRKRAVARTHAKVRATT